jgi:hypothetical protein
MNPGKHDADGAVALLIALAMGATVGAVFALSFLPWDFVAGVGTFWHSPTSDRAQALVGYRYFFADDWRFPVFAVATLNVPEGANVIFTDSIPLAALGMKILRAFGVPAWNYFGAWLLLCYAASGAAMTLALWRVGFRSKAPLAVAALMAAAMPVLLHRWHHFALSGRFVILLALTCYILVARGHRTKSALTAAAALAVVSLGVTPYLCAMVVALYTAALVQAVRGGVPQRRAAIHFAATCLVLTASCVVAGHYTFHGTTVAAEGFGHFSMNLASPFTSSLSGLHPESWKRLEAAEAARLGWPFFANARPDATGGQYYEGFNYLGIGLLLLCALNAPFALRNRGVLVRRHWPLLLVLAGATVFALSNVVHLGDTPIFAFAIPPILESAAGVFRSSGRFFWLVAYLLLVAATTLTLRRFGPRRGLGILAVAAALQVFDTLPLQRAIAIDARNTENAWMDLEAWESWLGAGFDRVYIVPSYSCGDPNLGNAKLTLQYYLARIGPIPSNSAYTARGKPVCDDEIERLAKVVDDSRVGWVFFGDGQKLPAVTRLLASPEMACRSMPGVLACTRDPTHR